MPRTQGLMAKKRLKASPLSIACLVAWLCMATRPILAGNIGTDANGAAVLQPVAPTRRIVVSIPDRKLALLEDGEVRRVYNVAVGAVASPSPMGRFKIINRVVKPSYYHTGKVVPPGRANPLGSRWLGLNKPSYGIHGTNVPSSIGKAASHGCIRMRNRDVEELFELVRPGDFVEILAESNGETARLFDAQPAKPCDSGSAPSTVVIATMAENS